MAALGLVSKVTALVGVRLRYARSQLRRDTGAADLASAAILALLGIGLAIGLAISCGLLALSALRSGDDTAYRISLAVAFFTCAFLAIGLPLIRGGADPGLDVRRLLVFPLRSRDLYAITVVSTFAASHHVLCYPTLAAICLTGLVLGPWVGAAGLGVVVLLLLSLVAWSHTLVLVLRLALAGRRIRELLAILGFLVLIAASLAFPAMERFGAVTEEGGLEASIQALQPVIAVLRLLPPGLAADAMADLAAGQVAAGVAGALWLLVWTAAGVALGGAVFARYHLDEGSGRVEGAAIGAPQQDRGSLLDLNALAAIPQTIRAVAATELRFLVRTSLGKFNLVATPLIPLLAFFFFLREVGSPLTGFEAEHLVLFAMLAYLTMFSNNFLVNTFMWDGGGAQAFFLSPAPLRHIVAGKNLGVWLFNLAVLGLALITWTIVAGVPDPLVLLSGVLIFCFCLLALTTVGNLLSVVFPVHRSTSSMICPPAQTSMLVSLVTLAVAAGLTTIPVIVASAAGMRWLLPVSLLVLLAGGALAYRIVLHRAGGLLASRREQFLEAVMAQVN